MRRARFAVGLSVACLSALGGCLFMYEGKREIRENEPRRKVAFESARARRVFEARALNESARTGQANSSTISIPFLVQWSNTSVKSPSAWYNDTLAACDGNEDKVITESEALSFNPDFETGSAALVEVEVEPDRPVRQAGHPGH